MSRPAEVHQTKFMRRLAGSDHIGDSLSVKLAISIIRWSTSMSCGGSHWPLAFLNAESSVNGASASELGATCLMEVHSALKLTQFQSDRLSRITEACILF